MDWEMKHMNGLKAIKGIIRQYPNAKILLVTNYDDAELRTAATEAGAFGFVLKEDLADLQRMLNVQG
jgi:NarL family two-component system response regulator LiaR